MATLAAFEGTVDWQNTRTANDQTCWKACPTRPPATLQYRRAQQQYVEACERYDREAQEVEDLLARRDQAYMELYGIGTSAAEAAELPAGRPSRANSGAAQQQQDAGAAAAEAANGGAVGSSGAEGGGKRILGLGRLFSRK